MHREQALDTICHAFESSCIEVFQSLNCAISPIENTDLDIEEIPAARIDAGNSDFEITISLHLPFSTLAMTYPVQDDIATVDEGKLEDWIAELSNRLMGKLKFKLESRNCSLNTGLPSCSFGTEALDELPENGNLFVYHFDIDNEVFETSISVELFSDEVSLSDEQDSDDGVSEGEIEFF